ncbi:protein kinase family protein, partial [archaeon]
MTQANQVMSQGISGQGLPEDINDLPACADAVDQAVQQLAVKMGVQPADLPVEARELGRQQLHTFLNRQVQQIRSASQKLVNQSLDLEHSFPADADISADFQSLGGPHEDRLGNAGAYGVAYKRCYKSTGKVYALKEINVGYARSRGVEEDRLLLEVETLQKISHSNVVRCYHSFFSDDGIRFCLVMELVDGQTLDQMLKTASYQANPKQLFKWLEQMARALVY